MTEDRQEEREELTVREQPAAGGPRGLDGRPTAGPAPGLPVQEEAAEARARPEENLIPDAQATPHSAGQEGAGPIPASSTASVLPSQATQSAPEGPAEPSTHAILTTPHQEAARVPPTQEVPKQPPVLPRSRPEEDTDPNSVHSVPRADPEGKTLSWFLQGQSSQGRAAWGLCSLAQVCAQTSCPEQGKLGLRGQARDSQRHPQSSGLEALRWSFLLAQLLGVAWWVDGWGPCHSRCWAT